MSLETATVGGWRCSAEVRSGGAAQLITLELDPHMGGMWPRVVIDAEAKQAETTVLAIVEASEPAEEFEGFSGMRYRRGLDKWCVSAVAKGAAEALRGCDGVEVAITSGGAALDTAEAVCERAGELATKLLVARFDTPRALEDVLSECLDERSSFEMEGGEKITPKPRVSYVTETRIQERDWSLELVGEECVFEYLSGADGGGDVVRVVTKEDFDAVMAAEITQCELMLKYESS